MERFAGREAHCYVNKYLLAISGAFMGKTGTFDLAVNALNVNITPSKAMREEIAKVTPEFFGYVKDTGGACIGLVKDT